MQNDYKVKCIKGFPVINTNLVESRKKYDLQVPNNRQCYDKNSSLLIFFIQNNY